MQIWNEKSVENKNIENKKSARTRDEFDLIYVKTFSVFESNDFLLDVNISDEIFIIQ